MRYMLLGVALAAVSTAVTAQDSKWGYFDGEGKGGFKPLQAGVAGSDGSQLILKCDRAGAGSTYAIVVLKDALTGPMSTKAFEIRPVRIRFDDGTTITDNWRFIDNFASAVDATREKAMTRLVGKLATAKKFEILFERFRQAPVQVVFDVTGAQEAIERVYESCKDKVPTP